jgi:hypothetical protein
LAQNNCNPEIITEIKYNIKSLQTYSKTFTSLEKSPFLRERGLIGFVILLGRLVYIFPRLLFNKYDDIRNSNDGIIKLILKLINYDTVFWEHGLSFLLTGWIVGSSINGFGTVFERNVKRYFDGKEGFFDIMSGVAICVGACLSFNCVGLLDGEFKGE